MTESSQNSPKRKPRVRIKDIATRMGLSVSAVSYALRNSPEVSVATRDAVQKTAKKMGYRPSPAMGALSEYRRSCRTKVGEGFTTLAYVHSYPKDNWQGMGNRRVLVQGLIDRADELGYRLEVFAAGQTSASMQACSKLLYHRGIQGVFVAPYLYHEANAVPVQLDWRRFAAISVLNEQPSADMHLVMPSWVRNRQIMLDHFKTMNQDRIGVCITQSVDAWTGNIAHTFLPHRNAEGSELRTIPPLVLPQYDVEAFCSWFDIWKPEVLVTNMETVPYWLKDRGVSVPDQAKVIFLDSVQKPERTGIDVLPREVAWTAVNLMNELLRNQSLGVPDHPFRLTVPGKWQDPQHPQKT